MPLQPPFPGPAYGVRGQMHHGPRPRGAAGIKGLGAPGTAPPKSLVRKLANPMMANGNGSTDPAASGNMDAIVEAMKNKLLITNLQQQQMAMAAAAAGYNPMGVSGPTPAASLPNTGNGGPPAFVAPTGYPANRMALQNPFNLQFFY